MNAALVIAVDGPAASGKGTIARALGVHYGLPHLDTGRLYRAVGLAVLRQGSDPRNAAAAERVAYAFDETFLADPDLACEEAGAAASIVAAIPAVRAALLARQHAFASRPEGAVIDGRDIGTIIAPHACAKLFVTAAPHVRAERRRAELRAVDIQQVLADIIARDARDVSRIDAPLAQAHDAALLDTSELAIDEAIRQAIALVEARIGRAR